MDRHNKIKLYRTLKVVFYCLGLPLFFFAVLAIAATNFIGDLPFTSNPGTENMFAWLKVFIASPAMYGVYVAAAVWLVSAIIHIVAHYTVKNRKTRMLVVIASTLICMLLPMFVMDSVFTSKIGKLAAEAPEGVTVESYETLLSYYRRQSGDTTGANGRKESYTQQLNKAVENFCRVYNIYYYGDFEDGTAFNTGNVPVTYLDLGIDFNNDGFLDEYDDLLVKVEPTGAKFDKNGLAKEGTGYLSINGVRYDGYWHMPRSKSVWDEASQSFVNKNYYIWYTTAKNATRRDGAYGYASYNSNGLLSDGYIYSAEVALNILEDYYGSKAALDELIGKSNLGSYDDLYAQIVADAESRRDDYYNSTEELQALWESEIKISEDFTLTRGELEKLVSMLGTVLGKNGLFDFVFDLLGADLMNQLRNGLDLGGLLGGLLGEGTVNTILGLLKVENLYLVLTYDNYLYIALTEDPTKDPLLKINLNEDFSLDDVSDFINDLLGKIGIPPSILSTVFGLLGLNVEIGDKVDLTAILLSVVEGLYWYQSPVIKPLYMFYPDPDLADEEEQDLIDYYTIQTLFMKYDMAYYEGAIHGKVMGSVLIGDSLGAGSYSSDLGLTSLAAVQQLKWDLKYKPTMYPLFAVRDMLMIFSSFVVMFMFFSFICAEKEIEWATGTAKVSDKKKKKGRKGGQNENDGSISDIPSDVSFEDTALRADENTDKGVE